MSDHSTKLCIPDQLPDDPITAAIAYADAGWYVLPIDQATKHAGGVLGKGWPQQSSRDAEQIVDWFSGKSRGLALHVGRSGAVALDVDQPTKLPLDLAIALTTPGVAYQSTRTNEPARGHYLFAVPPGRIFGNSNGKLGNAWGEVRGANGIIVVEPTIHEKADQGGRYKWIRTGTLAVLPDHLADKLRTPLTGEYAAVDDEEIKRWVAGHPRGTRPGGLTAILNRYRAEAAEGSRHNALLGCLTWACKEVNAGLLGADEVIEKLSALHSAALADPKHPNGAQPERDDFLSALGWAVGQATVDPYVDHTGPPPGMRLAHSAQASTNGSAQNNPPHPPDPPDSPPPAPPAPPPPPAAPDNPIPIPTHYTESAIAETFATLIAGTWNWCPELGWQQWNGTHWEARAPEDVVETCRLYLRELWQIAMDRMAAAVTRGASDQQIAALEGVVKATRGLQSKVKGENVSKYTRGQAGIRVEAKDFDADPELLNCSNGVINLRTGELLPHDPARLIRKCTGVDYRPDATHPDWQKALSAIVDDETRYWLRILFGSAATGYVFDEDIVPFFFGEGENGKSTVLGGVQFCLGSYSALILPKLLGGAGSEHETYMMSLLGARLAYLEELPRGHVLDMARIKQISGTAEITGRFLYKNPLIFQATHLLVVNTNYPPVVADVDHGTWRRLLSVPFPFSYDDDNTDRDRGLRDRVHKGREQQQAVLAWVVSGARDWLHAGRRSPGLPQACVQHTIEWRHDNDTIGNFLSKNVTEAESWESPMVVTELMERFNHKQGTGGVPWQMRTFVTRLRSHPYLLDRKLQVVKSKDAAFRDQLVVHGIKFRPYTF